MQSRSSLFSARTLGLVAGTWLACSGGFAFAAVAPTSTPSVPTTFLPNSIKLVEASAPANPATSLRAYVAREKLTSAEQAAPIEFEIALKMRNFDELEARVAKGEIIPSQEMLAKYDPLPADYKAAVDWASSQGLTVTRRDSHYMALFVSGPVANVARATHATFARVRTSEGEFTSAVTAPSVPATLAPLLRGINGLQPHLRKHKHLRLQPQDSTAADTAQYTPSQIATAYNASGLYSQNIHGSGQTIAIIIDTFPHKTDLTTFWSQCNIAQSLSNITFIQAVSGTLDSPSGEETLDTEWASGMAPGAQVRVYATLTLDDDNIDTGYLQVYEDVIAHPEYHIHEMSMSFGEGETYDTYDGVLTDDQYFAELSAAGVTCFASAGDDGATPDQDNGESGPVQAESPASDPNVTGVGGTTLKLTGSNTVSSETVWNDGDGVTGGGTSMYFNSPAWQKGTGVGTNAFRQVPDVSCSADPQYGAVVYFNGSLEVLGGTSWSAPTWAGLCALINQYRANAGLPSIGNLGPHIYPLIGTSSFRDITSGNNSTSGSNGYYAQTGYDEVTGVGTPLTLALASAVTNSQTVPLVQTVVPDASASYSVATSLSPTAYQWQRLPFGSSTWANVSNGGAYSGVTTASLTITDVTTAMDGDQFRCLLTVSGNSVTTAPSSTLVVDTPLDIATLAGHAGTTGLANGTGTAAEFNYPSGVAVDASGNVFVADFANNQIREVSPGGVVTTPYGNPAGNAGFSNGTGTNATFNGPNGVAFDGSGNLYVADTTNNAIRKISSGVVSTYVGSSAALNEPSGVAFDSSGDLYIADTGDSTIRKVTSTGVETTFAGSVGNTGWVDGTGTAARFNAPYSVAVDSSGNVFVADTNNVVVRKITPGGVVTTPYGQPQLAGARDGIGTNALFDAPLGLAVDSADNLYVTDSQITYTGDTTSGNNLLRRITPQGIVSTIAGNPGVTGTNDGVGTAAEFFSLQAVTVGSTGTIYLADAFNQTIRESTAPPTVSISATVVDAQVYGPVAGQFTVTRQGTLSGSLTVAYTVGGTAVAGTDYSGLSGSVTIPANAASATITVTPIFNSSATVNPVLDVTLSSSANYTVGSPSSANVTIEEPQYYQRWKLTEFGSNAYVASIGGDSADPNHNDVPNLLEYAFDSNPLQAGTTPAPTVTTVSSGGNDYLAITYTQRTDDPNLTYTAQVTSDLRQINDTWHSGPSYTTVFSQQASGSDEVVTVRDNTPLSSESKRFIRLQVSESQD